MNKTGMTLKEMCAAKGLDVATMIRTDAGADRGYTLRRSATIGTFAVGVGLNYPSKSCFLPARLSPTA